MKTKLNVSNTNKCELTGHDFRFNLADLKQLLIPARTAIDIATKEINLLHTFEHGYFSDSKKDFMRSTASLPLTFSSA